MKALRDGTAKHLPGDTVVSGVQLPTLGTLQTLGINRSLAEEVASGRETVEELAAEYLAALPAMRKFVVDYTEALRAHFGADNPKLRDFGIRPARSRRHPRNLAMLPKGTVDVRRLRSRPRGEPRPAGAIGPRYVGRATQGPPSPGGERPSERPIPAAPRKQGGAGGAVLREALQIIVTLIGAAALLWRQPPPVTQGNAAEVTAGPKAPCGEATKGGRQP
jgi:hypothetical protein